MKPLVSILIPAFNAEKSIAETLRSALCQTWPYKEIIVVDDGSTDRTASIARSFLAQGVKVIDQENLGAASARNRALSCSHGEFVQWLDADDLLSPNKIASQLASLGQGRAETVLSCPWGTFLYRPHRANFAPTALWCDLTPVEWMLRKLEHNLFMQTATWLLDRRLLERAGPWRTDLLGDDDGEYFCRVLAQSSAVRFVPDARVFYRQPNSVSLSYIGRSNRKIEAQFRSMQLHIAYMLEMETSPRARAACVTYLQNWSGIFYPDRSDLLMEAKAIAATLGGQLGVPNIPTKYALIQKLFGRQIAREAQIFFPRIRWASSRLVDRNLLRMERCLGRAESIS